MTCRRNEYVCIHVKALPIKSIKSSRHRKIIHTGMPRIRWTESTATFFLPFSDSLQTNYFNTGSNNKPRTISNQHIDRIWFNMTTTKYASCIMKRATTKRSDNTSPLSSPWVNLLGSLIEYFRWTQAKPQASPLVHLIIDYWIPTPIPEYSSPSVKNPLLQLLANLATNHPVSSPT